MIDYGFSNSAANFEVDLIGNVFDYSASLINGTCNIQLCACQQVCFFDS